MEQRPTNANERILLKEAGYIKVDGLPVFSPDGKVYRVGEGLLAAHLGVSAFAAGVNMIITKGGEMWACRSGTGHNPLRYDYILQLLGLKNLEGEEFRAYIAGFSLIRFTDYHGRMQDPSYHAPL